MKIGHAVHRLVGGHEPRDHTERMVLVGRHAALYDQLMTRALGWLYRSVASRVLATLPHGADVLDVGTGPGRLLVELATRRPDIHLTGIDPSADMVSHANRRLEKATLTVPVDIRVASAECLPFPDDAFDAVVSTLSSHHWADPTAAIAEQARVLRPGGALWIFDLRAVAPATVTQAMATDFPPTSISRARLGSFMSSLIAGQRAQKSSVTDGITT